MTVIYSSVALKNKQREVKDAAMEEVVHITENGNGAFVFCSERVFDRAIQAAKDEAVYEARLSGALDRADADMAAGRFFADIEEARNAGLARGRERA